jgi:hypothetical protein
VFKNTSFSHTLAANAVKVYQGFMKEDYRVGRLPSPPLIDRLTLLSAPVALKCPRQRTTFSQLEK